MVLVDTSVWIEVFRRGKTLSLESVVDPDDIVTCLPVIQEVLQGFDDERAYRDFDAIATISPLRSRNIRVRPAGSS